MATKRKIEVFTAGCPACDDVVAVVRKAACPSCDIHILDMHQPDVAVKAKGYAITTVPAVAIDGKLAECCIGSGPTEARLRKGGLGRA